MRACAVETHVRISQEPVYTEIYRKNAAAQIEPGTRTHISCEPAQSKRTSRFDKSQFIRKITGKMPQPRLSPEPGHTFCASLRSRNACQDFTRATLYGKLQKKNAAAQSEHPDQAPAFTATVRYRKNPYEPLSMDILFGEKAPCRMSGLFGIDEYIPFPRLVLSEGVDFQQRD